MKSFFLTLALVSLVPAASCFGKELPTLQPKRLIEEPGTGWTPFFGGCSWYCGAPGISTSASASLEETNGTKYPPKQAHDSKMSTVWSEGVSGNGEGEKLTFTFSTTQKDTTGLGVTSCAIAAGHQGSRKLFKQNARPKRLELAFDGKPITVLQLNDTMGLQQFDIPKLTLQRPSKHSLSLKILEVYPGTRFQDTCISEVYFQGTGQMH